ncbi:MAG: hypothetical protein DWQ04_06560 [Chloroflexi bacterium]|nr:MAG: hypothetical protein DWQ04_06560 [Chloroflexota bacterium]
MNHAEICHYLESSGFVLLPASMWEETVSIIEKAPLDGNIIISDWAATVGNKNGLKSVLRAQASN